MAHSSGAGSRSLYHRWRSRDFSELVAQEHVTRTLKNAVATGRIVHAYLFCGPRGTGKTSSARILAKAVNCLDPRAGEPCNRCAMCTAVNEGRAIDLIEIDAASNRGIDDARDLREKIKFSPAEARYKVYIIDEAHMLTSEASNALLKTLEEPPEHALLILATTEAHKILPTIASRCQRFDFRRIPLQAIVEQLEAICNQEGLEAEPGVLDRVARMARGSLRDAESLLDQLVAYCGERIDLPSAREVLGLTGEEVVPEFAEALRAGDLAGGFRLIDAAAVTGADLRHFSREVVDYLRALMVAKSGAGTSLMREFRPEEQARLGASAEGWGYRQLLAAIRAFGDLDGRMRLEPFNQVHLEVAFTEAVLETEERGDGETRGRGDAETRGRGEGDALTPTLSRRERENSEASGPGFQDPAPSTQDPALSTQHSAPTLDLASLRREWPRVRKELASNSPATAMVLQGCEPVAVAGGRATFGFETETWRARVERLGVRDKVWESLNRLFGTRVDVQFKYGVKFDREAASPDRDPVVEAAVREFGFKVSRVEEFPE